MTNPKRTISLALSCAFTAFVLLAALATLARAPAIHAQGISIPCSPPAKPPTLTIKLAEAIPEYVGGKATMARGTFFQNKITVDIIGTDAVVCLASSPSLAPLQVDDQLELLVGDDKSRSEAWVYDFYDKNTKGIIEAPAQNISRLFAPGTNVVRIELRDFKPDVYSTRQIWLVIWQGTPPTATPTPLPPTITLGIEKIELGRLETLADAPSIVIPITSTSPQTETLSLTLANLPGVTISPTRFDVGPHANVPLTVRLAASGNLAPQVYAGALVLGIQGGTRLSRSQVPLSFEIVTPQIKIEPALVNLGDVERIGPDTVVTLNVTSTDTRSTPLRFTTDLSDVHIVRVEPDTLGANETRPVRVHLASSAAWNSSEYSFALKLEPPRSTVTVSPEKIIVRFRVPSLAERVTPFLVGALALVVLLAIVWFTIPAPEGQLVGISDPTGQPQTFQLKRYISPFKGFNKRITIGSAKNNDIRLNHPSVASHHAVIYAQRRRTIQRSDGVAGQRTALTRRTVAVLASVTKTAMTQVNGVALAATGHALEWNDRIRIGEYEFEYR